MAGCTTADRDDDDDGGVCPGVENDQRASLMNKNTQTQAHASNHLAAGRNCNSNEYIAEIRLAPTSLTHTQSASSGSWQLDKYCRLVYAAGERAAHTPAQNAARNEMNIDSRFNDCIITEHQLSWRRWWWWRNTHTVVTSILIYVYNRSF